MIDSRGGKFGVAEVAFTGCTIQHNHLGADSAKIRIMGNDDRECRWGHITLGPDR